MRRKRKLKLNRATIRHLQVDDLDNAAGGAFNAQTRIRCTSSNSTVDFQNGQNCQKVA